MSLVRANATGLKYRLKIITHVCVTGLGCGCALVLGSIPFFAAAAALILASISLHKVVTLERVQREGSKKKEYDSVADEWVHQRVTESESDDDSVEALTVRTPLQ